MVGRSLTDELYRPRGRDPRRCGRAGEKVLSVQNLSMQNVVRNTSFSIFAGQVTGIFGLVGSGRTETARIIAGVAKRDFFHGGDIRFEGRSVRYRTPRQAVGDGVVYVTEDRKGEGFFETMSVAENIYIGQISSRESQGIVVEHERDARARRQLDEDAQTQDAEQRRPGHRTFRRQSAEGRHRQGAGPEAQADHLR